MIESSRSKTIRRTVTFFGVAVALFWSLAPIYWIIVTSLKTSREIYALPPTFIPKVFTLANYRAAMDWSFRNMC